MEEVWSTVHDCERNNGELTGEDDADYRSVSVAFTFTLTLYRAEVSTGYILPSRSNLHF